MNIFIISGLFPSDKEKFGGIFVEKRYQYLKKNKDIDSVDLYRVVFKDSIVYKKVKKILFKNKIDLENNEYINQNWKSIYVKRSIFKFILNKISKKLYCKYLIYEIEKQVDFNLYNLIHAHWCYPTGYLAKLISKKYKIPYVVTCHGSDIHTIPLQNKRIKNLTINTLNNAGRVIFVSNDLLNKAFELGYNKDNSEVIYNGVELEKFKVLDSKRKYNNSKKILYIGRLEYIKGVDRIPEIMNNLVELDNDIEFSVIGNGSLKNFLNKKMKDIDINYKFIGQVDHNKLFKYLNESDVLIIPSRNESFGCVAIEAQACGTKIVASKVGGLEESVGDFGILVEEGEHFEKRFAEGIIRAFNCNIEVEKMRKRSETFDWMIILEKEVSLYEKIIGEFNGK
ncbi:glycosyltransferase [Clostridium perfringens]|uniref:glycosyltransferase n=1 Tax=Clostridium perfringens TaxID=1502 RepID=UPI0013E2BE7E|nr:glycosyltransferase [Clostridium perfringens]MDG6890092.1 putative teichuronic acid biosynthesis glycosyltransferase TuaC [Clostridium perfringens]MDK0655131.1 glycosyltransferase [Clostridium perfringens]MDK0689224.1 glycosyltransferase [Clostridium perfringens]MDM0506546.1 glycosyltransferase [Clostridium perfringens]MDM0709775.1 glycosyltransferase [Clostridium perfringens]